MSSYHRDQFDFIRQTALTELETISKCLDEDEPDRETLSADLMQITTDLTDLLSESEKVTAEESSSESSSTKTFYSKYGPVPGCLPARVALLIEIITALATTLSETKRTVSRAVLMTAMLSSHVGRLSLNSKDDRKDITARHCDAGAMGVELKWVPLSVGIPSEKGTEALDFLEEKWDLVNEGIEGCGCLQCVKRNGNGNGNGNGRGGSGNGEFSILADQTEYY